MNCLAKRTPASVVYAVVATAIGKYKTFCHPRKIDGEASKIAKKKSFCMSLYEREKTETRKAHGDVSILPTNRIKFTNFM